uniref:HEAT repeat domain-containing protein n=1 Tax=Candidatus Electronema sp. TaxID=2698783 RepID=UPI004056A909
MRKVLKTALPALLLMTAAPCFGAEGGPSLPGAVPAAASAVAVEDNLLSLRVRNMPLKELLRQVAAQAGMKITVHGPAELPVSAEFSRAALEDGLKRIAPDFNIVFTYGAEKKGQEKPKVEKIVLHSKTAAPGNAPPLVLSAASAPPPPPAAPKPRPPVPSGPPPVDDEPEEEEHSPEYFAKLMKNPDAALREEALGYFAGVEDSGGIAQVSEMLINDSSEDIRRTAAEVLADLGGKQAVPALGKALADKSSEVRSMAVYSLGQIGGPEAVALIKTAMNDANEEVRNAATDSLGMAVAAEE